MAAAATDKEAELASLFDKLDSFAEHGQHSKALKIIEQSECNEGCGGAYSPWGREGWLPGRVRPAEAAAAALRSLPAASTVREIAAPAAPACLLSASDPDP
jgi:hypothetical protein